MSETAVETTIETSPEIGELAKAMVTAQAAFQPVEKDAANPHFQSRYVSLAGIVAATRPALNAAGVWISQSTSVGGGGVRVTTRLQHGEQFFQSTHSIPVSRADAQGIGSALTYAKRQAMQALLVLAAEGEDDDGEGAVGRGSSGKPPLPPKEPERPTLKVRAERLEKTLTDVKLLRDLDRAWKLAADLIAELRDKEPAVAARVEAVTQSATPR